MRDVETCPSSSTQANTGVLALGQESPRVRQLLQLRTHNMTWAASEDPVSLQYACSLQVVICNALTEHLCTTPMQDSTLHLPFTLSSAADRSRDSRKDLDEMKLL